MMKKLSILIFLSVILLFTGCSQKLEEGILKVDKEYKEKNAKTKVYYVDNNYEKTREQLNKLVNDLNNNQIIPPVLTSKVHLNNRNVYYEPTLGNIFTSSRDESKNVNNVALDFQYKLDDNSNYIVVTNKKYTSNVEAYKDYENIMRGIWSKWLWNSYDKRDEFGVKGTFSSYSINEVELKNNGIIKFTTEKERVRNYYSSLIKKQILDGGYEFVDKLEDADKIVEIEFGRDYNNSEIRELKKLGKPLDIKFTTSRSDFNLEQSSMNVAGTLSNSSSVGAGVGLGLVLIGALIPNDSLFVPIFIKVIDKKENKEFLVDGLAATDPLTYDKKFMSDEIYERVFNSDISNKQLRDIQYNIYSGLIKGLKVYQKSLDHKK
jgi:exonuclease VII small subunit